MRWGVLRHRPFALLFSGQAISSLGDRLVPVALAFAVLDITGSVTDLTVTPDAGTLAASTNDPVVLATPK